MEQWYPALREYIENNREAIVNELFELVRIPSLSKPNTDGLPFGKASDDVLNAVAALYGKHGFPMQVKHELGYALSVLDGAGDGIGIFSHADVVPVNDDWVVTEPFNPVEKDGVLYGRGMNDNKAGVISTLYALKALDAVGVKLRRRITVFTGGSEETGAMQDISAFERTERQPAVCLVPDSGFPVSVGEKGILRFDCRSEGKLTQITKFEGGRAYNVVLDRVTVVKDGEETVYEGLAAHAAHPELGENATYKAAKALCEDETLCENDRSVLIGLRDSLSGFNGEELDIASEGVFGKLTCANGIVKIEDGHLVFTLDIRYGNEFDYENGIPRLQAAMKKRGYEAICKSNDPGFLLDEGGKEMECILSACREVANRPEAKPYKTYGATYARHLKNAFAMNHSLPWDKSNLGLPAGHGGAHQSDECLSVDALLGGIACLAVVIARLDALEE